MIAPDANLLIYAYTRKDPFHQASRIWLESIFGGTETIGIPILCIHAFMRVQTHPSSGIAFQQAAATVDSWLELPQVRILYPGEEHWDLFQQLCSRLRIGGTQLTDAAIEAIAIEHDAVIHTNDRDFARFPGLRWINPLKPLEA